MEIKISDLLAKSGVTGLPGGVKGDPERVREAVMRKIKEENVNNANMNNAKKRARKPGRILLIAAVVAALLSVAGLAYGLGLNRTVDRREVKPGTGELLDVAGICTAASAEGKASSEWDEYRRSLPDSDMQLDGSVSNALYYMGAYNSKMAQKLEEIAEKYSLALPGEVSEVRSQTELYGQLGSGTLLPGSAGAINGFGRVFDTGSFDYSDSFSSADGPVEYNMFVTAKGTMPSPVYFFADMDSLEQSDYTASDGSTAMLGLGDDSSVIFAEMEHSFVMINVRSGIKGADSEGIGSAITREDLEYFADSIDFAAIDAIAGAGQK